MSVHLKYGHKLFAKLPNDSIADMQLYYNLCALDYYSEIVVDRKSIKMTIDASA